VRSFKLVVVMGLGVSLSACGGAANESSPELVPADQVKELQEAGASLGSVDGPMPLVVLDSLKIGVSAAELQKPENETLRGKVSAMASAMALNMEGSIPYDGGWWGISTDTVVGNWCMNGRTRSYATATTTGKGWCTVRRWHSDAPTDCRIVVHIGAAPFEAGTCYWQVYDTSQ